MTKFEITQNWYQMAYINSTKLKQTWKFLILSENEYKMKILITHQI